jgi:hypothetical protein
VAEANVISVFYKKINNYIMKKILTLAFVFAFALASAQNTTELPRTEFTIDLSESSLLLKPGESKQVTVSIARSKSFKKEKAILGLQSSLPKGVTVSFEPKEGNFESSIATISVATDATVGMHQLIMSAELSRKKKGTILKITVGGEQLTAK